MRCAARRRATTRADRPVHRAPRPGCAHGAMRRSPSRPTAFDDALAKVRSIDDDRILRRLRALVEAIVRTNAFAPAACEAIAFKIDSSLVPGLPAPVPWREIWVYSPRVEGIHLRGGPVARGGLRWSDRRDDFRTEILGLMKAQMVKNAVIVPTGAKGGFYPKHLPSGSNRDAWLAEGTESYRIFIRSLLSVTDNLVNDKVVHPDRRRHPRRRGPLFRRRRRQGHRELSPTSPMRSRSNAASGSATPSPAAARTATTTRRWGSPRAARGFRSSGISSKWASTSRPTRSRVVGCGDMSGDVFGNGMLLSQGDQADRRLRPSAHLHRSQPRPGAKLGGAQAPVRPAAIELGRL